MNFPVKDFAISYMKEYLYDFNRNGNIPVVLEAKMIKLNSDLAPSVTKSLLDCHEVVIPLPVCVDNVVTKAPNNQSVRLQSQAFTPPHLLQGCPPSISADRLQGSSSMVTMRPYDRPKEQ